MIRIRPIKFTLLVLLGAAAVTGGLALFAACTAHAKVVMDGAPQPVLVAAPVMDQTATIVAWIGAITGGLSLILTVAFQILKIIAPLTPTKIDDEIRDGIGEILDHVRGQASTTVVVQPAAPRPPEGGFVRPLLLVAVASILAGAVLGFGAVALSGCAAAKRAAPAVKTALIDCGKEYAPALVKAVAKWGAAALSAGKVDWSAVEADALALGREVGSCAVAEFVAALKAQSSAEVRSLVAQPDEGAAVLARVSGGAEVRPADGAVR